MVVGFAFLALIGGAIFVVMAISNQSSSSRSINAAFVLGRYATELAESAVDECLAEFMELTTREFPSQNRVADLTGKAEGGVVPGANVFGKPSFSWPPQGTLSLVAQGKMGFNVSPVTIKPLYYSTVQNYGEIELSCHTSCRLSGKRELYRRVTSRHYFLLDAVGQGFRINPVASRFVVDRSAD